MSRVSIVEFKEASLFPLNHTQPLVFFSISPPLIHDEESIDSVVFALLTNLGDSIKLNNLEIQLAPGTHYVISIKRPDPLMIQPRCLNNRLLDASNLVRVALFRETREGLYFVEWIFSSWRSLPNGISELAKNHNWQARFMLIKRINDTRYDHFANFFKNLGQTVEVLIIKTNAEMIITDQEKSVSTESLPSWPKMLIFEAFRVRTSDPKRKSLIRRVITAAVNGGIAVDLLNTAAIPIPGTDRPFTSANFSKTSLNLSHNQVPKNLQEFEFLAKNFEFHIDNRSSEASLNGLFWFLAVNYCMKDLIPGIPHRIDWEWLLNEFLPGHGGSRLDLVVRLGKTCFSQLPILLVESGKDVAPSKLGHKDNSKMLGMLSAVCIKNAYEIAKAGMNPAHARAYGLLIGGTRAQLFIAHPEFRDTGIVEDGKQVFEIHANISFSNHWVFDMFSPTPTPSIPRQGEFCEDGCCNCVDCAFMDTTMAPAIPITTNFDAYVWDADDTNPDLPSEDPLFEPAAMEGQINFETLHNFKCLLWRIAERLEFICKSDHAAFEESCKYSFVPPKTTGLIVESMTSKTTPIKRQTTFEIDNTSVFSSAIAARFQKLSLEHPNVFPIMVKSECVDENLAKVTFEPTLDAYGADFLADMDDVEKSLALDIKFALDCLHGLYWYHERVGASFDGKIEPGDIRFSLHTRAWKLFNLKDVAVGAVDDEMRMKDLRALGNSLFELFFIAVLRLVENSPEKASRNVLLSYQLFQQAMVRMKAGKYPTAIEAMKGVMKALTELKSDYEYFTFDPVALHVKSLLAQEGEIEALQEKLPVSTKITEVQSPRIEENPAIANEPQQNVQ